ncbi:claudin-3-like [Phascolarctos cinereus]|uniref:Uncharacterized protein LOC110221529 n=1 Tax=Phascolarctos cinereus TaxID=38626 RepID=A0A6P5LXB3_PHACI|nr:uncharacterized protein LOC110221529 [Phascolarctos cinereus]XP_020861898.1 uncharacterized protein LOC110221529 [Phascolarctos cinereus]XP_020861899.1 uncharacterized protein LOC110221529 [Phascolarctos cinereus]XP_020861900.1 uncharacterized protein LOC110221529 [Phascolarctos cinereus]
MTFKIRQFFSLMTATIFALVSWFLCIDVANSVYWRVWYFHSQKISIMWIGLWRFCYLQHSSNMQHKTVVCMQINSSWVYPIEFHYGKDLITLPIFLQVTGMIFSLGAFLIIFKNEPYPHFIDTCHLIAGCCFILSSISVGVSVTWNTYMDLRGHSTLEFPRQFPVKMNKITKREIGLSFPMGISSAASSFISGIFFFCQTCCSKLSRIHPQSRHPIRKLITDT